MHDEHEDRIAELEAEVARLEAELEEARDLADDAINEANAAQDELYRYKQFEDNIRYALEEL